MKKLAFSFMLTVAIVFIFAVAMFPRDTGKTAVITPAQTKKVRVIDGDTVWKQQCSRCHLAPGAIPKKKMITVIRHMRDVAPLTDEEYRAILEFVTK